MYVRRKPNKTGTVSVQDVSKHTGKYQVIRIFGAGRTEEEPVPLEEQALTAFFSTLNGLSAWTKPICAYDRFITT